MLGGAGLKLLKVEGRAQAGRGVGGTVGSAAFKDQDDDDDEQECDRAAEAGSKRHKDRVTYDARPLVGIESYSARWARSARERAREVTGGCGRQHGRGCVA